MARSAASAARTACGVGNGNGSSGVTLTMYGGLVVGNAGNEGCGAFGLDADPGAPTGKLSIPDDFKVEYEDADQGKVFAPGEERLLYAQTSRTATIEPCEHELMGLWPISDEEHAIKCPDCLLCESRGPHVMSDIRIEEDRHYAICLACGAEYG